MGVCKWGEHGSVGGVPEVEQWVVCTWGEHGSLVGVPEVDSNQSDGCFCMK